MNSTQMWMNGERKTESAEHDQGDGELHLIPCFRSSTESEYTEDSIKGWARLLKN